ncbi:trypsin-4-like isoform X2 [Aethina tumida]|nr:trypsin-4-like isoform X2 [Aethina tumida]
MLQGSHICGGTIISNRTILTAAHCTNGQKASFLSVRVGSSYRTYGGQVIDVARYHQHPKYTSEPVDYDVSVLILKDVISHKDAKQLAMASNTTVTESGVGVITGWGTLSYQGILPSRLQMAEVPIVNLDKCKQIYSSRLVNKRAVCAGGGSIDSCQGDSGGPLVVNNTLVGIVSWGRGCGYEGFPGVYASVSALRSFIDESNSANNLYTTQCIFYVIAYTFVHLIY